MVFNFNTATPLYSIRTIKSFIRTYAHEDNWHELNPDTGNLGYGWIHYANIRNIKPKRVLCIGSRYGFIPAICALACKDNGKGIVDFVDAGYDQNTHDPNHWGGIGLWKKVNKNDYFKPFGLSSYINLHVMTSAEYANKHPKRTYSYIHLDGDHSYNGVKSDYNLFWPSLLINGSLCLHDIYTTNLGGLEYGVNTFWQEQQKKNKSNMEYGGICGLGILQKK